jgi:hypothetical protein
VELSADVVALHALEDLDDDHATAAAWTSRHAGIDGGTGGLGLGV